ncbi:nucleoside triphosphate pyrophosphohydrolase [Salmonella phage Maynard]|uniref:Nucleoside triphosphate pyrophosphohydrolase n=2 Tax=Kuttervirus TaxID=2169536 RepID=U5PVJ1_9CAUD|nr:MazG-like pyrophosphatase [Salmonella phage Maynard]YP_008771697.1 MazG-like pyrophosphatase [Salmonella phage Marshall]AGY47596.1 nucleoside triphosphate pyrophosphohydrolase [Salmonella phage Marshall]AGY47801.1 nucleoside triphosphate pyrophosphohydrolase [Salmonella phage Maynard]
MTTTFSKNVNLNLAFGNAKGDVTSPDFGKIRNQAKLVLEETRELLEAAFFDHDVKVEFTATPRVLKEPVVVDIQGIMRQIMDAQGDITTVNDGVAHIAGFDGDECLQRVYASNMSKFVRNEGEVVPALEYYYNKGFPRESLRIEGEFPQACIKVVDTITVDGKEYPAGKFLKNMATFKEPDFSDMLTTEPKRQITEIILTGTATPGRLGCNEHAGVAFAPFDFIDEIMGYTKMGFQAFSGETVESYIPVFVFNEDNFPTLPLIWGEWKANVRIYVSSPVQSSITQLTRID